MSLDRVTPPPPSVRVRLVESCEHDRVAEITVAAYRQLPGAVLSDGYAVELADVAARAGRATVLVAEGGRQGQGIVGAVAYVPDHTNPYAEHLVAGEAAVRMLAVDPRAQRSGAGRALLVACIDLARAAGRERLVLHSTPWMTAAHRLYERAGFRRAAERDWWPEPEVALLGFVLDLEG